MTDVIFAGSDGRAAGSMAEVSLVLDRQGVALAPQFGALGDGDEISITRRIYRDGTGEFLINKNTCRLKDIHELFMDTGVGRRAYSIIEQGQIDRMINVKPEDRRYLFEEVAGITKYKAKRKEAERKLEQTRTNMTRLHDILAELEKQIRSLKVQAGRARKFKEIKGELELVDRHFLGRDFAKLRDELSDLAQRREELIRRRAHVDAVFSQGEAKSTELEVLRIDQEKRLQELSQRERDCALRVEKLSSQLSIAEEKKRYLTEQRGDAQEEQIALRRRLDEAREGCVEGEEDHAAAIERLEVLRGELGELEQFAQQQTALRADKTRERDTLARQVSTQEQRLASLESQVQFSQSRDSELSARQSDFEERLAQTVANLETIQQKLAETAARVEECQGSAADAQAKSSEVGEAVRRFSDQLSATEDRLFERRDVFQSKRSRLESLRELQENLEGYAPNAREVLLKVQAEGIRATPLAEIVQPSQALEEALEDFLGAVMNTLLVATTEEAERVTRFVVAEGMERVRVVATEELRSRVPGSIAGATPMLDGLQIADGYATAVGAYLANVYVVDNTDQLLALRKQHPEVAFIARETRVVGATDRSISAGKPATRTGVFSRKREIEELTMLCAQLETEIQGVESEREALLGELKSQETQLQEVKERIAALHVQSVELRKERERYQVDAQRVEKERIGIAGEAERNQITLEKIREDRVAAELERNTLVASLEAARESVAELIQVLENFEVEYERARQSLSEKKIEVSALEEKKRSLDVTLNRLRRESEDLEGRIEDLERRAQEALEEAAQIDERAEETVAEKAQVAEDRNQLIVQLAKTKEAFDETCTELQEFRLSRQGIQAERDQVLEDLSEAELGISQAKAHIESIQNLCAERYQSDITPVEADRSLDFTQAPLFEMPDDWHTMSGEDRETLLREHLTNLREKVNRYGEVNLTAIHEFDEVQKRNEFLLAQQNDLDQSILILQQAILKIDESTRTRFQDTYEAVNKKFGEIFPILFNGGKAELTLVETEGSLDPGVDIMVQPPGKRLQSITLLSGGEKALTAVSLVLSIFARKPSPFCLLDEVDAPLDDANVSRFNTVIRKMAEKTQFIVITHNKKTMEIAESLYGVTMEKPGVSKMSSVRLN